jgi:hypothetical protein
MEGPYLISPLVTFGFLLLLPVTASLRWWRREEREERRGLEVRTIELNDPTR